VVVSFIGGGNWGTQRSHWQTLSHNVVSSTPLLSSIQTHNFSGDRIICQWSDMSTCGVLFQWPTGSTAQHLSEWVIVV
jgi:hypothetical protein